MLNCGWSQEAANAESAKSEPKNEPKNEPKSGA